MLCSTCSHDNPLGQKFCGECGARIAPAAAAAPAGVAPPQSTPQHLAERILMSRAAMEGERKQVTVLFADLKGSMELLADRDPEEARKLLDPILERMMEAVHHFEGTVNQVMGDGIMALFGAPLAHEDHAVRACYAALRMQESVNRYSDKLQLEGAVPVAIRVGINSGEVVVRAIGSDLHMDYTAVGQTTHLASRIEQLARPGTTLISPATLKLVEGYVQVNPLGHVPVKGLTDPVELFRLVGVGIARTRLQAAAARGLTRFVGRDIEMERVYLALTRALGGDGQVVSVVGEPGVGKSRLYYEFLHSHRLQGTLLLQAGSVSYGKATAYKPIIDLLTAYFDIEQGDDGRRVREKVAGKLIMLDLRLESLLPPLLSLLGAALDDKEWARLDPAQRRRRTLDAVQELLVREAQVQPLMLVLEDLHWIDDETQALLDSLVKNLGSLRILLLTNYRPEYSDRWVGKPHHTRIALDPLATESAQQLLSALLGPDPGLAALRETLLQRTAGNPFFLEESVRSLVETGTLAGGPGAYQLAHSVDAPHIPATVQSVLAARIDRLPQHDKRLLQTAAVIGKDFSYQLLRAVTDRGEGLLREGLARLQAAEFLYETTQIPLEYTFKHALTHEVAYGTFLSDQRRDLHVRILHALERGDMVRNEHQVEQLAHHALKGEVWDSAVRYLRQSGAAAAVRGANREAVVRFGQTIEAFAHCERTPETDALAIDLRLDLRAPLSAMGAFEEVAERLREAEALAVALGDQRRLGRVLAHRSQLHMVLGEFGSAIELGERASSIGQLLEDVGIQVTGRFYAALTIGLQGDYRRTIAWLREALELLQGPYRLERFGSASPLRILVCLNLAWALGELGEFGEAIARKDEAYGLAVEAHDAYGQVWSDGLGSHVYLGKGDFAEAIHYFERGLTLATATGSGYIIPWVASGLGAAYLASGRIDEAVPLLERAVAVGDSMRIAMRASERLALLAEARNRTGRRDEALTLAAKAVEIARARGERGYEAWALWRLGSIRGQAGEDPRELFEQALSSADEFGMRPLQAWCHLELSALLAANRERDAAQRHLEAATALCRDMDTLAWLAQPRTATEIRPVQ
jgi:class 3 adenylate cyclase/tetratricopeptide (TPR) repeat protein